MPRPFHVLQLLVKLAAGSGALLYASRVLRQFNALRDPHRGLDFHSPHVAPMPLCAELSTALRLLIRSSSDVALRWLVVLGEVLLLLRRPALLLHTLHALRVRSQFRYGSHARQTMDVYSPPPDTSTTRRNVDTLLVWVHGGAWAFGDSLRYAALSRNLAAETGASVVTMNYRAYPHGCAAHMADDVLSVVRWVRTHPTTASARRVILIGHSAGAHLVTMATLKLVRIATSKYESSDSRCDARELLRFIAGVVGVSGVYHIADHYEFEDSRRIGFDLCGVFIGLNGVATISPMAPACGGHAGFTSHSPSALLEWEAAEAAATSVGSEQTYDASVCSTPPPARVDSTSPFVADSCSKSRVGALLPPFWLLHGVEDGTVPASSTRRFAAALQLAGCKPVHQRYCAGGHADAILAMCVPVDDTSAAGPVCTNIRAAAGAHSSAAAAAAAVVAAGAATISPTANIEQEREAEARRAFLSIVNDAIASAVAL